MSYRAFVSSTFEDLKAHRKHVIARLRAAGFHVDPMEDWPADAEEPREFSQKRVDGCDLCVLLVAFRRGFVPPGETRSITQLEYQAAIDANIDVLVFMVDPEDTPWSRKFDELDKDPLMRPWREQLRLRHGIEKFGLDPASLDPSAALTRWVAKRPGSDDAPPATWLPKHLAVLLEELGRVPVPLVQENRRQVVSLDEIYVPLKLRVQQQSPEATEPTWITVLKRERAALTGDAGSGKSTLLRYLAVQAAKRLRTAPGGEGPEQRDVTQLAGEPARIPIVLDLATSAGELLARASSDGQKRPAEIPPQRWLPLLATKLGLTERQVEGLLNEGNVLLLFDGVDEVPDAGERELLVDAIAKLQLKYGRLSARNHVVVTCRDAAWGNGEAYTWFEKIAIQAMDRATIHEYLTSWCRAVWGEEAVAIVQTLEKAFSVSPAMGDIASNPQLTTLLALVEYDGPLPRQQARLFERFIQKLERTDPHLAPRAHQANRQYLTALAVAMQSATNQDREAMNALRVEDAERLLGQCLERASGKPFTIIQRQERGRAVLDALQIETGLVEVQRASDGGPQRALVRFRHRTFQEYLAASYYAEHGTDELLKHVVDPAWSKVLALTSGVLTQAGGDSVKEFLEAVLQTPQPPEGGQLAPGELVAWAPRVAAASVCVAELATYDLDADVLEPARRAHDLIVPLLDDPVSSVEIRTRVRIAEGLGSILDPRLRTRGRWVTIPAGPFIRGSAADEAWLQERPPAETTLAEFRVQRWPVTVAEYRRFIEEGDGYRTNTWWPDDEGRRWKERYGIRAPLGWEKNRSKGNRPVTGVSWWEARAFCRWWETVDPELPDGWIVELPSESQWEKSARGGIVAVAGEAGDTAEKCFPWGDAWTEDPANCAVTGIGDVVPVGLFRAGHSRPFGLWDMAGNISEHCLDGFGPLSPAPAADPINADYTHGHVVRGGSFASPPLDLRLTYRFGASRDNQDEHCGFRCVAIPKARSARGVRHG